MADSHPPAFDRPLAEYLHRNYYFELDGGRTVDGARASNETRYINHEDVRSGKTNCVAKGEVCPKESSLVFRDGQLMAAISIK